MAVSGRTRKIYLSVEGGATNTWIAGEISNSLDISRETFGGADKSSLWDDFSLEKAHGVDQPHSIWITPRMVVRSHC
jgi:hypothetical protein